MSKKFPVVSSASPELEGFILTGEGTINKKSFANAALVFEQDAALKDVFKYNELAKKTFVLRNLPWEKVIKPRPISDNDEVNAAIWLERTLGITASTNAIHSIILATSDKHRYNPIIEYLDSLRWDNQVRIDMMLCDLLGVEENLYSKAVSKKFMIGSVARAYNPGCKMDNTLVLEGKQGRQQKSSFIEKLYGSDFFGDAILDIGHKDTSMLVTQKWCFEIPELDALEKKNSSEIKAWLTRKVEEFRSPYGRNIITVPRPCVFIGTTNEENYLKDSTGGRRFWPVVCRELAHEEMLNVRDQLWAEAVKCYKAKEKWWLVDDEVLEAEKEQEERHLIDAWEIKVADYIYNSHQTTIDEVMQECLLIPIDKWNRSIQMRVAGVLQHLGWEKKRVPGDGKRKWAYRRKNEQPQLNLEGS